MKVGVDCLAVVAAAILLAGCGGTETVGKRSGPQIPPGPVVEKAIVTLRVQSQSPDASVRANCIEALEKSTDPRAMEVIEQGLRDPEWVVRFAAAMATGKRQTLSLRPTLQQLAVGDPNDSVRAAAIYALRRLGDTANMNVLAKILESPDPAARANTALVLGMMGDASAVPLLALHRDEKDTRVRFQITAALARLGDEAAQKVVIALALSKYAEDQWNAMMVCADLPAGAEGPLVMGLTGLPETLPPGTTQQQKEYSQYLTTKRQLVAARSLGMRGSLQGLDVAAENHDNADPGLRALAALALGEIVRVNGLHALAPMLDDPDAGVQRAAAAAVVNVWSRAEK